MSKTIEITVAPDGSTKVETKGFFGKACKEAAKFLFAALGVKSSEKLTDEFYRTSSEQQNTHSG